MSSPSSSSPPVLLDEGHFDVVLLGTSLTNSLLSAALAKAGKTVLHLDRHDYYGAADASHPYTDFIQTLTTAVGAVTDGTAGRGRASEEEVAQWRSLCGDEGVGYTFLPLSQAPPFHSFTCDPPLSTAESTTAPASTVPVISPPPSSSSSPSSSDATQQDATPPSAASLATSDPSSPSLGSSSLPSPSPSSFSSSPPSTSQSSPSPPPPRGASSLPSQSRHFSIDVTPALVLSRSSLVEVMVASNVSSYVEFKSIDFSYLCPSQQEGPSLSLSPAPPSSPPPSSVWERSVS